MNISKKNKMLQPQAGGMHERRLTLNPGDFRFFVPMAGVEPPRLYTLLGSCVSVILWHPERRMGGMSHALLQASATQKLSNAKDGRYCEDAITLFAKELMRTGTSAAQYHAYLVGGGNMFPTTNKQLIGDRNVEVTRACLKEAGFRIRAEHVCGDAYRTVELDLNTGNVMLTVNKNRTKMSF